MDYENKSSLALVIFLGTSQHERTHAILRAHRANVHNIKIPKAQNTTNASMAKYRANANQTK
jgi:hypothetical protein